MHIDTASKQWDEDTARILLDEIYGTYLKRRPDETGLAFYLPIIQKYGFLGYISVIDSVIHSTEMKDVYTKELKEIWFRNFNREPSIEEVTQYKDLVLFYRHARRAEIQAKITDAEQIRQEASKLNSRNEPNESAKAEQLIAKIINKGIASSWQIWHEMGLAQFRQKKYETAILAYQKAIGLNHDDQWLWSCEDLKWCYLGLAEGNYEKLKEGLEFFLKVTNQYPHRWIAWHECGHLAWKLKDHLNAINYYHEAIEKNHSNPSWGWSATDLMSCYRDAGLNNNAYEYFLDLTRRRPNEWGNWHALGWVEWNLQEHNPNAVASYQKAVSIHEDGGWVWSWNDLGYCLMELMRYQESYEAFTRASAKEPQNWEIWHSLGRVAKRQKRWDDAFTNLTHSIELNPNYPWSWQSLGNYYLYKPESEFLYAWLAYKKALRLSSNNAEVIAKIREIETENRHRSELRKFIHAAFDKSEFKILCYDVGMNYEDLPGDALPEKQISLIDKCFNLGKENQLFVQLQIERQNRLPRVFHSQYYKLA